MSTRLCWLGHACLLLESDGKRVLIDPFLTGNPTAAATAEEVPADLILVSHGHGTTSATRWRSPSAPGRRSHQLRDQPVAPAAGAEEGPGPAARRRPRYPVRPRQADAGVPRLGPARRQQRRQPVRLLHHLHRRQKGLRRRRHRRCSATWSLIGEEGIDLALLPIGDYYTMGPDDAAARRQADQADSTSCRSTTTRGS